MIDYKKNLLFILVFISGFILFTVYSYTAEKMIYNETCTANWVIFNDQGRANLTIDFMYNKKNKTGTVALTGNKVTEKVNQYGEILNTHGLKTMTQPI